MKTNPPLTATLLAIVLSAGSVLAQTAYDKATAHQPDFENKEVWPMLTGQGRFLKQEFPG